MTELFSTAARAGAGGTKSGLVGLRPMGKKGIDFLDTLTPQRKKKKNWREEVLPDEPKNGRPRDLPEKVRMILPRNFCPDCGDTNRPQAGGCINVNVYAKGRPGWRLPPNSVVLSFFCTQCYEKSVAGRNDNANELQLAHVSGIHNKGEYESAQRLIRIRDNTEAFISARLACGDESIYVQRD